MLDLLLSYYNTFEAKPLLMHLFSSFCKYDDNPSSVDSSLVVIKNSKIMQKNRTE